MTGPRPEKPKLRLEVAKLRREKRGSDREVVVIEELPTFVDLEGLAREIKARCGTGGTVKGRTIEIQGDHRDAIAEVLLARGFRSKRAGG
ncbi:MAG: translation initiation factor [Planctomycetales bacterium]|nr:translation initiation factor [Planctomycetales bacterium]